MKLYRFSVVFLLALIAFGIWANYQEHRKIRQAVESFRSEVPMSGLGN